MFCESIDATPNTNNQTIPKLLTPPRPCEKRLPIEQQNREHNAIRNERRAHNKVRQTLTQMIPSTKTLRSNPTKQKLHPRENRHHTPQNPMSLNRNLSNLAQEAFLNMQLQRNTHSNLRNEHKHKPIRESRMSIRRELPALMRMAEKVSRNRDCYTEDLDRDVPSRSSEPEHHACWEDDSPGEALEEDVDPEGGVDGVGADGVAVGDFVVAAVGVGEGGEEEEGGEGWSCAEG
jgi:hypothetical protein